MSTTSNNVPDWKASGDWFDVCKCSIPCPCEFAQAPKYGEAALDGLNVLMLSYFKGNIWAGEARASIGLFFDEKADPHQREALQMIFSGKAGGFMAEFAKLWENVRGTEFAPIRFEVSDDLSRWS